MGNCYGSNYKSACGCATTFWKTVIILPVIPIDELIRSRRKTIALIIQPDGRLIVRAPLRASQAEIQRVLERHRSWILKKQAQVRSQQAACPVHTYRPGDRFLYLGKVCQLEIRDAKRPLLALDGETFYLARSAQQSAAAVFRAWYRAQAARFIPDRVAALAKMNGFHPRGVRITSARTRWGSCSQAGNLSFTWRLMIAPPEVIDYVILHELTHLEIKNHTPAFWERLKSLVPEYKERVRWLKAHAQWGTGL